MGMAASVVLLVALVDLPTAVGQAVGARGVIAYAGSVEPGKSVTSVATIRADRSERQVLTEPELGAPEPIWSPDGQRLAFSRSNRLPGDDGAVIEIVVMSRDGGDRRVAWSVEHPDRADQPGFGALACSPDGSRIAFTYNGVRTVDVTTGVVVRMTTPPAGWVDVDPSWSPENDSIAFTRQEPLSGEGYDQAREVHVVNVATRRTHRLVEDGFEPRWSPDGRWIAFWGQGLEVVAPDGSERRSIGGAIWSFSWSPDGRQLAYTNHDGVWAVTVADGEGVRLAGTPDMSMGTSWSADGRHVAYSGGGPDAGLWVAPVAGGAEQLLDPNGLSPQFSPGVTLRPAGPSRVDTAVTISRATFLQAHTAVLARADLYPDALAGAPLAAKHGAPLLLTAQDGLLPAVKAELRRLGVDTVYLLGSEAALASQVEQDVRDLGITTIRRLGKNGPVRHGPAHRRRGRWRGGVRGRGRGSSATETAANASFWWEAPQHQPRCGGGGQTPSRKRCRT